MRVGGGVEVPLADGSDACLKVTLAYAEKHKIHRINHLRLLSVGADSLTLTGQAGRCVLPYFHSASRCLKRSTLEPTQRLNEIIVGLNHRAVVSTAVVP